MRFPDVLMTAAAQSGSGYDASAVTYFNSAIGAGATFTPAAKSYINTLILGLKSNSLWTKLDALWLLANETSQGALIDIVGLRTASAVNSPTFTANQGYAGNGTTSYVNTTFNLSTNGVTFTQNSAHMMVYDRTSRTDAAAVFSMSCSDGLSSNSIGPRFSSASFYATNSGVGGTPANANAQGMYIANRTTSAATQFYRNGSSIGSSGADTSVARPAYAPYVGAHNAAGTAAGFTTDQHAAASIGGSLSSGDASTFTTLIEAYMDAIGAGVIP